MNSPSSSPFPSPPATSGRYLAPLGLACAILGIVAYVIQLQFHRLTVPWYMPFLALIGIGLAVASVWARQTVWRVLVLIVLLVLGGLEVLALSAVRLPPYAGPVIVGKPFPAFEAKLADGTVFSQAGLAGDSSTALVFFRGRW